MKSSEKKMTAENALRVLENAQGKDFYTVEYQGALSIALDVLREKTNLAHWIFSGDEDDYDGYYINCSKCGAQRMAYDQDNELDIPVACPHCGIPIDINAWEYRDVVPCSSVDRKFKRRYAVAVLHVGGTIVRPYTLDVYASDEDDARELVIKNVAAKFPYDKDIRNKLVVDYVVER